MNKLKDARLVSLEINRELSDELDKYVLLNGDEYNKSDVIRGLIKGFLEIYDEDSFTKDGDGKKKISFLIERDVWQCFGEVCGELGISRSKMLQVLIKKLLSEEVQN